MIAIFVGAWMLLAQLAVAQTLGNYALRCGSVIDAVSNAALPSQTILIRGQRISAIGRDIPIPAGTETIDLSSATCLPGLMDLHAHVMYNPRKGITDNYLKRTSGEKVLTGLRNAQTMLRNGFTTIRDPGDFDKYFGLVDLRDAIARGEFIGPRMLVAPHAMTTTGGHADLNDLAADITSMPYGKLISGAESTREAVREEIKYGADWIKLHVTGGVMSAHDDPRVQTFTNEELHAAVDETHRHRRKITVHAIGTEGIKASILAGVDSVEHGILIDKEGIDLLVQRGTYLVPTLYALNFVLEEGARIGIPAENIAKGRSIVEQRDANMRKAFAAGVKVAFGSDTLFPVEQAAREFAVMVKLGLTPLQAIRTSTVNAADLLGLRDEIGSIETGKRADIIAVSGNPLDNIRTLETVKFVMKDGQIVRNDYSRSGR